MSGIEINKIVGAILSAALVTMVISVIGNALVHPREHEGSAVKVPEAPAAAPKKKEPELPLPQLLASADAKAGKRIANRCRACHNFEEGAGKKIGPDLWNVVGRKKASMPGFSYSSALKGLGGTWTYEDLFHFLKSPRAFASGTKMTFAGISNAKERAEVIAYLRTLSKSPKPLP